MALIRAVPLKNFLESSGALSTCAAGTAFNVGALSTGQYAYAGLHLTAVSTGRPLIVSIQSATASGFGSPSTQFTFALSSAKGSTWGARVGNLSTEHKWWRATWSLSTAASTAGSWRGLVYMGIR